MRGSSQYFSLGTHCAPQAMSRVRVFLSVAPILSATSVLARDVTGVLSTSSSTVVCLMAPSSLSRCLTQTRLSPWRLEKRLAPFWSGE